MQCTASSAMSSSRSIVATPAAALRGGRASSTRSSVNANKRGLAVVAMARGKRKGINDILAKEIEGIEPEEKDNKAATTSSATSKKELEKGGFLEVGNIKTDFKEKAIKVRRCRLTSP